LHYWDKYRFWLCLSCVVSSQELVTVIGFKVCESMHHHTIQINQPTRCNNSSGIDVYAQLNMFRASSHPSPGAQQLQ
jgi:hypothetical protein